MAFDLQVMTQGSTSIVTIFGDVDVYTAPRFDDCLQSLLASGKTNIAVDLENCTYFDSEGIKAIIRAIRKRDGETSLTVVGARGIVLRVFEITGLKTLLKMLPSVNDLPLS
jgi:anti-sigma B factor antagonist